MFFITLITVAIMLLYAVPGFLLVKSKLIKENSIKAFATLLMYASQPCMMIYAFQKVKFSIELTINMIIILVLSLFIILFMVGIAYLIFRKKHGDVKYRIATLAMSFGNCMFMGLPLLESLLPDYPEGLIFSTIFSLSMNIVGWTLGSAVIANDKKYCSIKKAVLNPAVLALVVIIPLFCFNITIPDKLSEAISLLGRMATPLCMLIMGMRLATMNFKKIFLGKLQYISIAVKQFIMPLLALILVWFLPIDFNMKLTFYILCSVPVASVVLNFSEMIGEGQEDAANTVLLGTMLSIITIPIMLCWL